MKYKILLTTLVISPTLLLANDKSEDTLDILNYINKKNDHVLIFEPNTKSDTQMILDNIYGDTTNDRNKDVDKSKQRFNEFGDKGYAYLFIPGEYNLDVKVGYSTQVLGLGETPNDVHITGAVRTQDSWPHDLSKPDEGPGALDNFWRSVENISISPTLGSVNYDDIAANENVWGVSQAAPMRRVHIINGNLRLNDKGWSSGGFLSNSKIDGYIESGSQQQWFSMNNEYHNWNHETAYNTVFIADIGNKPSPGISSSIVDQAPQKTRTKPYILIKDKKLGVMIPNLKSPENSKGVDWNDKKNLGTFIELDKENFVFPSSNDAENIQKTINQDTINGWHVAVLTPGEYKLDRVVEITNDKTLILGIGMPVLKTSDGYNNGIITTSSPKDTILAGFLIAGSSSTADTTLVTIGDDNSKKTNNSDSPNYLFDLFCRVGGPKGNLEKADTCIKINDNNVIGSNVWLWRADHDFSKDENGDAKNTNTGWNKNTANHGLIVNGDYVTMYGLFVEHFQKEQTIWNGTGGSIYFYQSELPYDVPKQGDWIYKNPKPDSEGKLEQDGYPSLVVNPSASGFYSLGLGIYSVFINVPEGVDVKADNAMYVWAPNTESHNITTAFFDGTGGINHIINGFGGGVYAPGQKQSIEQFGEFN